MGVAGWVLVTVSLCAGAGADGNLTEALAAADARVREQPGWELPRLDAARLRLQLGQDLQRAEADLLTAQSLAPENPRAHFLMGLLREEQGRDDRALDSYRKALVYRPSYDEARLRLAGLLYARRDLEGAEREYRILSENQPDALQPRLQLASVLEQQGRFDEAEQLLRALWEGEKRSTAAARRLLALYEQTGQAEKAKRLRSVLDGPAPKKQHRPLKPSRR